MTKAQDEYRNYKDSKRQAEVEALYKAQHEQQTYAFVQEAEKRHAAIGRLEMTVWEAIELLDAIVDESDPDNALPQIEHALQTAEACRAIAKEGQDWLPLVGLIHDLGKVLAHPKWGSEPQWCVVGDTFPVGCAFSERIVLPEFFTANPDAKDPRYNTECGVYQPGCGLRNVKMSWGHDEYLYRVLRANQTNLPDEALYLIRFHSFYPWHTAGAYGHLCDDYDRGMLPLVQKFQQCDLYSKVDETFDKEKLKPYYQALIDKYIPGALKW
eukprot:TRINITY_DN13576_c0_g1_i1.p1 TRINITY_DN13576_c0_g1~~TRINITY_DN13576_c0_g1_i1.p1  ORF type:complete len:279 (-),score=55.70 TRINITY_DN13576_c0_g1_i1:397-1203(-)